jgi:hypothetical protein
VLVAAFRTGTFDVAVSKELIRLLIEEGVAYSDINGGEMIKDDSEEGLAIQEDDYESESEKNFVEAYKNCMTPLQLACILG